MGIEEALGKFTYGVYVVGVNCKGRLNGITCAWVSRVSHRPPLVVVSVGKKRFSYGLILEAGAFSVNVLARDQVELARHFGLKSGRDTDKFAGIPYYTAPSGSPILPGVAAWLDCRLVGTCEAGDHTLFIGEVLHGEASDSEPLLYDPRDYWT